ncbi:phosphotransferase family protein [bacterium]|nr:phosphotransferase family protein [Verrucomicrobiota bacterium]MDA7644776.1 phosphotransferase family protein [bacterium]
MSVSQGVNPTIEVRNGESFDVSSLVSFLNTQFDSLSEDVRVSQYPSGRSNLTYLLEFSGRSLVMRRPPFGTKAKTAHDMSREFTVMSGLKSQFGSVPEVFLYCADESVIGADFIIMEKVDGALLGREFSTDWGWGKSEARQFCVGFWDRMVALHSLKYSDVGMGELGKPFGYVERQIRGWNRRFTKARTSDAPSCEKIMAWLEERIGEDGEACVLHNDYRIDNVILDSNDRFRIAAVLDWEMAAVGNPLMDLGNSLAYWTEPSDSVEARKASSQPSDAPGMLTRKEIIEHYGRRTGRDVSEFSFYYVYGLFRLACIIQQIYYRYYHKQTSDERFAGWVSEVHRLAVQCEEVMDGKEI